MLIKIYRIAITEYHPSLYVGRRWTRKLEIIYSKNFPCECIGAHGLHGEATEDARARLTWEATAQQPTEQEQNGYVREVRLQFRHPA